MTAAFVWSPVMHPSTRPDDMASKVDVFFQLSQLEFYFDVPIATPVTPMKLYTALLEEPYKGGIQLQLESDAVPLNPVDNVTDISAAVDAQPVTVQATWLMLGLLVQKYGRRDAKRELLHKMQLLTLDPFKEGKRTNRTLTDTTSHVLTCFTEHGVGFEMHIKPPFRATPNYIFDTLAVPGGTVESTAFGTMSHDDLRPLPVDSLAVPGAFVITKPAAMPLVTFNRLAVKFFVTRFVADLPAVLHDITLADRKRSEHNAGVAARVRDEHQFEKQFFAKAVEVYNSQHQDLGKTVAEMARLGDYGTAVEIMERLLPLYAESNTPAPSSGIISSVVNKFRQVGGF